MTRKALIVATSHDRLGNTGKSTGFYWEELAAPYWELRDAGVSVEFASIKGGKPPADPGSDNADDRPEAVARFMADTGAMAALAKSKPISDVVAGDYDAVFLPGGHGTMWDFPGNAKLARVIADVYEANKVVAAVCHGPSGLLDTTLSNGDPLIKGKRVNGFSNEEEEAVGLSDVVPFHLETELAKRGGQYESGDQFQPYAVRDGRLITGQNPQSSKRVAELMVEALNDLG